jgi:hypothetical protein
VLLRVIADLNLARKKEQTLAKFSALLLQRKKLMHVVKRITMRRARQALLLDS